MSIDLFSAYRSHFPAPLHLYLIFYWILDIVNITESAFYCLPLKSVQLCSGRLNLLGGQLNPFKAYF